MTEQLIARRWTLSGRVQGVGFRWSTQLRARDLGLSGWVRNLPDGRVEVVARGGEGPIGLLEAYLDRGPLGARVESVEKATMSPEGVPDKGFHIK